MKPTRQNPGPGLPGTFRRNVIVVRVTAEEHTRVRREAREAKPRRSLSDHVRLALGLAPRDSAES